MSTIAHLINGDIVLSGQRTAPVFNPSIGEPVRQVELADRGTIQAAIDSAKAAFPAWRNTQPEQLDALFNAVGDVLNKLD